MTFAQPFSDYEVLDRVGAGSMGTVFKARHKKLNRIVALKVLKPSLARDIRYVDRLRREARIVASLNHPNIVTGYDLGQEEGYHFFVMEFIEGQSLRELLHQWGMFAEDRVLDVAIQITTALDHAFAKGVIHRDIKPANILIDTTNVVKLTDMGLAKGPDNLTITRDGATVGTPQYISPEQARSAQDVDVRSDLYSLGATLFHMCTGQPPFRAESMANVLIKVLNERAPSAAGINPDLSDGLNLIIRKLLSKDPEKRYQTPAELLTDLRRVQRSEAPNVALEDLDTGEDDDSRKKVWWAVAVVVPILALVSWFMMPDDPKPAAPGLNPRTLFRQEVIQGLRDDKIIKIGDKLRRIGQLEIGNDSGFKKEVLASLRQGFEDRLADDLPGIFRALRSEGFEALDWIAPESMLKARLAGRIKDEFAIEARQLPGGAQAEFRREWIKILQAMNGFTQQRDAAFKARVNARTKQLLAGLDDDLRGLAIRTADVYLAEALSGFGTVEDCPAVTQLPPHLQVFVETKRKAVESVARSRIDATNQDLTGGFARAMDDLGALVVEWTTSPDMAIAKLDEFERYLENDYPPRHFRVVDDPWKVARRRLKEVRTGIVAVQVRVAEAEFAKRIKTTYRIAVGGDLAAARAELKLYADPTHPRFPVHLRLLDYMVAVRRQLLAALAPSSGVARKSIRNVRTRDGSAPTKVETVRLDGRIVLFAGGAKVPLSLLNVRDLVGAVPGFEARLQTGGERAGLAAWYVLSHQDDKGLGLGRLIDQAYREVFRIDLVRSKLDTSLLKPPSLVAQQLLDSIKSEVAGERWATARTALGGLRKAHAEFARLHFAELSRLEKTVEHGLAVATLKSRLEARRRSAKVSQLRFEVKHDLSVTVGLDIIEQGLPEPNRRGWVRDRGGPVRYEMRGEELAVARERALVLPSLLDVDQPTTMVLDLSFPEEGRGPRVLFVECHGATIGLGLLRDGHIAVFPVDRGLDPLPDLSRKTKKARKLTTDQRVLPGARHRFYFVMRRKPGTNLAVVVRVFLDERPPPSGVRSARKGLGEVVVQRPNNPQAVLRLTPLSPVTVHSVEFRGRG